MSQLFPDEITVDTSNLTMESLVALESIDGNDIGWPTFHFIEKITRTLRESLKDHAPVEPTKLGTVLQLAGIISPVVRVDNGRLDHWILVSDPDHTYTWDRLVGIMAETDDLPEGVTPTSIASEEDVENVDDVSSSMLFDVTNNDEFNTFVAHLYTKYNRGHGISIQFAIKSFHGHIYRVIVQRVIAMNSTNMVSQNDVAFEQHKDDVNLIEGETFIHTRNIDAIFEHFEPFNVSKRLNGVISRCDVIMKVAD